MKKKICNLLIIFLSGTFALHAQTVLRYETHGYLPNLKNEVHLTEISNPGPSGRGVAWDFSGMEIDRDFAGVFDDPAASDQASRFHMANTMLEEFGNLLFFKSDHESTKQYGHISPNGFTIDYEKPFVKMKYPFSYGDAFSGDFKATVYYGSEEVGIINGQYNVVADASGRLDFPEHISYANALRVKESKTMTQNIQGQVMDVELVAYRWYVNEHRFPIMVLLTSKYIYPDGNEVSDQLAAYNPVFVYHSEALSSDQPMNENMFNVYPNPVRDHVSIRFFAQEASDVAVTIVDHSGRRITELENTRGFEGEWHYTFTAQEIGLAPGTYMVQLRINDEVFTQKLVLL